MNKQIITGVVVALVIVGAVLIFKGQGSKDATETPVATSQAKETTSASPPIAVTNSTKYATLQEAYKSGKSLKCTVTASSTKLTYYFKDGNMRSETSLTSGATKIETGQIIRKDVAYAWTNMSSDIVTVTDSKMIEFTRNAVFQLDTLISNPKSGAVLACAQMTISNSLFDKPKN